MTYPVQQNKPSVFDAIRQGFAFVAAHAAHVTIRHDRLDAFAAALPSAPPLNVFDDAHHYTGGADETAAYVLALDAINFGSGYKPLLVDEGWALVDGSIYYTLSTRLKQQFEQVAPLLPATLRAMTDDECRRMLALPRGRYGDEFTGLCAGALRELGAAVGDSPRAFAGDSAESLVTRLAQLPHFRDIALYQGREIPILKRAQIAAADMHLAFSRGGAPLYGDSARLTMFADNAVPHVLRVDGVLEYSPALAARVDTGQYLPSGSAEEVEIRACAGHAVELVAARKGMTAMAVDHLLWHRRAENDRYRKSLTHLTLTHYY